MGIQEKIKEIQQEMDRTQKNKATEHHMGLLKARIAKLQAQLLEPKGPKVAGEGFDVVKFGDARIALIGFPSVGKSTLMSKLTGTESEAAAYEFTTLTCIPGTIHYNDAKIQMLDLPGIIEGAAEGKGRGRQVIASAKSADVVLMVLDAQKGDEQRPLLERELEMCGLRLNTRPPDVVFRQLKTGGIQYNSTVKLSHLDQRQIKNILNEYRIHSANILFRQDVTVDEFIDVIASNRKYVPCLYAYNKIDCVSIEEVDQLARRPNSVVISSKLDLNLDRLMKFLWDRMALVRIYTKRRGEPPAFEEPVVLTHGRGGCTVKVAVQTLHQELLRDFKYALVWGQSCKHSPQTCGLSHELQDEDVVQVFKK